MTEIPMYTIPKGTAYIASGLDSLVYKMGDDNVIKVYPVLEVRVTTEGFPATVSPYVVGPCLTNIFGYPKGLTIPLEDQLQEIEDAEERRRIGEVALESKFGKRKYSLFGPREEQLHLLSQTLNRELGVRGINIRPLNIKVQFTQEEMCFVITDLCGYMVD